MTPRKRLAASNRGRRRQSESEQNKKRARYSPRHKMENGDLYNGEIEKFQVNDPTRLGPYHWVDRSELIRLLEQTLESLGYHDIATKLEDASQVKQETQNVVSLRKAVMNGDWDSAMDYLHKLPLTADDQMKKAEFLLIEAKILEAMQDQDWKTALTYLREELAPLSINLERVHEIALFFLCPTVEDLKQFAKLVDDSKESRERVLLALQDIIPANVMLPQNRLIRLLEQAVESQMNKSLYHNAPEVAPTLFSDYAAGEEQIPTVVTHELWDHSDEVWHVEFSNDGKSLASCSRDGVTIIWQIHSREKITKKLELREHKEAVMYLAWSPNDQYLATTSRDRTIKLWEMENGKCVGTIQEHEGIVTCMGWLPDGKHFVSGSNDERLCLWDLAGTNLKQWKTAKVQDLVVSRDGGKVITVGSDKRFSIFDLESSQEIGSIDCHINISAITLSKDGTKLLASTQSRQIHLLELNQETATLQDTKPLRQYKFPDSGDNTQKYIIQACFGGLNEAFILSGSEECVLYVWHKQSGKLIKELEGHSSTVNSVSWNPVDHTMFASASDDRSVSIWGVARNPQ